RTRLGILVFGSEDRSQGRHLGLSVEIPQAKVRQPAADLVQHLDRHSGSPVVALHQTGQIPMIEIWVIYEIQTVGGQNSLVTRSCSIVSSILAGSGVGKMLQAPRYTSTPK